MIQAKIVSAAMAGALVFPGTGISTARHDAGPDPVSAIAGTGFAKVGDLIDLVPVAGPLATGILEPLFRAAEALPIVGGFAKVVVDTYDRDHAGYGSGPGFSMPSGSGTSPGAGAPSKPSSPSLNLPSLNWPSLGQSSTPSLPNWSPPTTSSKPSLPSPSMPSNPSPPSVSLPNASLPSGPSLPSLNLPSGSGIPATTKPAASAKPAATTKKTAPAHHAAARQPVAFPKVPFRIRQRGAGHGGCAATGVASATVSVASTCGIATVWVYDHSTGEVHPSTDAQSCLAAPLADNAMATVQACASLKPWMRHWYLSVSRRMYVLDGQHYNKWRFLGVPGPADASLAVGGASQKVLPSVAQWDLPTTG